jgi:hypothetical protein
MARGVSMNDPGARKRGALPRDRANGDSTTSNSVAELIMASQRKNIEGIMRASQAALDGAVAVWRRQLDFAESSVRRHSSLLVDLDQKRGSPGDQLSVCVEFLKKDFEENLLNARALLELSTKASNVPMQIINERLDESFSEALQQREATSA